MDFLDAFDVAGNDDVSILLVAGDCEALKEIDRAFFVNDLPVGCWGVGNGEIIAPLDVRLTIFDIGADGAFVDFDAFELAAFLHHHVLTHRCYGHVFVVMGWGNVGTGDCYGVDECGEDDHVSECVVHCFFLYLLVIGLFA